MQRQIAMSVKYIKIRFNTENADDMNVYNAIKGADGQNAFIKKAILYYAENGKDEALAERIADIVFETIAILLAGELPAFDSVQCCPF